MKISTKFIGVSAFLVGAIALIAGGGTVWRNQAEEAALNQYTQSRRRIELATQLELSLHQAIIHLKDDVLLKQRHSRKADPFYAVLKQLKALDSSSEIDAVTQRYQIFQQLQKQLIVALDQPSATAIADQQQDFRAINSFGRDIKFFIDRLIDRAHQDAQQAQKDLDQIQDLESTVSYSTVLFLMLIVLGEFWLIMRPIIQSLKLLQDGSSEIGSGNLSHRLGIHTQDEIAQVARAFNQMADNLTQAQTTLQQQLAELAVARDAAETANRTKSEFLANMNHELRTPLNGILGYAQILERDPATIDKQRKGLKVMHQCANHLLTLINDILDLSKLEVQKMELYPQDFHFANFLSSTVDICRVRAEQKGVDFRFQPGANLPATLHADDKRLRQVLLNLLSNAVKFTDLGTVTFRVESVEPPTEEAPLHRIRFQIKDTGIGIAADKLATIFLPFEQAGKRERNSEGTGLGLAISEQIIEKMGSHIHVESVLGKGSCFWFEVDLPLALSWTTGQAIANQTVTGYQGERRKILVVDDREENRLVAVNMLEPIGFKLVEANSGQQGLTLALQSCPDLIITDVHMADMDGLEMTRRLRQLPDFAALPIIASPATLSKVDIQDSLDAGCTSFLPKPIDFNGLIAEIQRLLNLQLIYAPIPAPDRGQNGAISAERNSEGTAAPESDLIFPPSEALQALYIAAQTGCMSDVQKEANHLKTLAPKYISLANRILDLNQQFDDQGILKLLEPWV